MQQKRIGIFSGTFDPVHKGHIAFALDAINLAGLDEVYFAPEVKPRNKSNVSHFAHRVAMLKLATKPHAKLQVIELPDAQFTPLKTTPRLTKRFSGNQLFLVVGSDLLLNIHSWPGYEGMLRHMGIVAGVREHSDTVKTLTVANALSKPLIELHVIESSLPDVSSRDVRIAIESGQMHPALLTSVHRYISKNWLYSSPSAR